MGKALALDDFELAIQQGSSLIWPYFYLAHHCVTTGQFDRCRVLCERGLEKDGPDSLKSEFAEWLAISQSELGFPPDIVRGSFERAIRFDPSNERARNNLSAFEAATQPIQKDLYETRTSLGQSFGIGRAEDETRCLRLNRKLLQEASNPCYADFPFV